jgi:hypothetical protein
MLVIGKDEDGIVTLSGLAAAVRTSTSNLQDPLRSLVATGLLSPIESGDSRSKFYVRNPSPSSGVDERRRRAVASLTVGCGTRCQIDYLHKLSGPVK